MPRRSTPARGRRRPIIAAIGGLAIGIAGVGATLPAAADPAGGDGSATAAPSVAAAPTGSHRVTLITGDRVTVTDLADGT
ncbi:hypothetical protein V7S52_17235, partial [Agromyces sp. CCNWLW208]